MKDGIKVDSTSKPARPAARPRFVTLGKAIPLLFAIVALLILADLHSSLTAGNQTWEVNPFVTALGERIGAHSALVAVKAIDALALGAVYLLWRVWKADIAVALVLFIASISYVQIVTENYLR